MDTKLTLRLDEKLIEEAKREARTRGTSVSKMVAAYFRSLGSKAPKMDAALPPATASIFGSLHGKGIDRAEYRKHLEKKYR
jgi:hypothetical protein